MVTCAQNQFCKSMSVQVMLGIAISKHILTVISTSSSTTRTSGKYGFLYYTESNGSGSPLDNRVYRYELADNKLTNPKTYLKPSCYFWSFHYGGKILIGP